MLVGFLAVVLSAVAEDVVTVDGLERSDLTRLQFVADHRSGWMLTLAALCSRLGSFPVLAAAAVLVGLLLWRRGERLFVALTPLAALLAAGAVVALGKHLVDRTRPPWGLRVIAETEPSFPSGHSGDSAALLLTAALLIAAVALAGRWNRVLLVLVAGLSVACIGVSRMILGVHYPTDVLAGWALGAIVAVGLTTATLLVRHRLASSGAPRR